MKSIKRLLSAALLVAGFSFVGSLRPAVAAEYPQVNNLSPFTSECNYMSRQGYLRLIVFQQSGEWISVHEAKHVVAEQIAAGS